MLYCDAKHSDILRGTSHVCCYLLEVKFGNAPLTEISKNTLNLRKIIIIHKKILFYFTYKGFGQLKLAENVILPVDHIKSILESIFP